MRFRHCSELAPVAPGAERLVELAAAVPAGARFPTLGFPVERVPAPARRAPALAEDVVAPTPVATRCIAVNATGGRGRSRIRDRSRLPSTAVEARGITFSTYCSFLRCFSSHVGIAARPRPRLPRWRVLTQGPDTCISSLTSTQTVPGAVGYERGATLAADG